MWSAPADGANAEKRRMGVGLTNPGNQHLRDTKEHETALIKLMQS